MNQHQFFHPLFLLLCPLSVDFVEFVWRPAKWNNFCFAHAIMIFKNHEKRKHQRRPLQVPVICYPSGDKRQLEDWIFGKTVDVGVNGLRVNYRGGCLLESGIKLDLFVLSPDGEELTRQAIVPNCIRAQVAWVDKTKQIFAVEYQENC